MKIGVVTTSYPRFAGDPAGGFVQGHVAALRALGHDVEVIAAGERDEVVAEPEAPGARIVRVRGDQLFYRGGAPERLERAPLQAGLAAASFSARLSATLAFHLPRWDLVIAHWLAPSALAVALARAGRRPPLLAIAHGGDVHTLRRTRLLGPTLAALRAGGARLVFVSEELRAIAKARDAIVQPMGIALDRFGAIPRAPSDPPTIAVASRLVQVKGVDVAIAAMQHVRRPARLMIAGDGPERAALTARAPVDRVTFLGAVDTRRRDELLGRASVVVVPSRILPNGRSEGTPLIALEALAAGVPVVASAVGGLREVRSLSLVRPDDPRQLAAAIEGVLAHPPSPAALRGSVADLGWPDVAARLLAATA
jgi:glycosyltransferase involved in cell wall biosynthesis